MTPLYLFNYNTHTHTFVGFFDEGVRFTFFSPYGAPNDKFIDDLKSKTASPDVKLIDTHLNELKVDDFWQIVEKIQSRHRTSRLADFFGKWAGCSVEPR